MGGDCGKLELQPTERLPLVSLLFLLVDFLVPPVLELCAVVGRLGRVARVVFPLQSNVCHPLLALSSEASFRAQVATLEIIERSFPLLSDVPRIIHTNVRA